MHRCPGCAFLWPAPRAAAAEPRHGLRFVPGFAPGGVLRGKYRLIDRLGEGAHGVSYLAEHEFLGHPCVVKVLTAATGVASDAAIARLRAEARAGYRVNDPNVVRVLDCDVVRGTWYFVMEYVEGFNLATPLGLGLRLAWPQARRIGLEAARGLAAIHRAGLLHRDVKPGNLILGVDGRVRVADLGVARLAHERREQGPAAGPELVGTLTYAAPEMFLSGGRVGPESDLYSLGATLYHLLTGRTPHGGAQVFRRLIDLQTRPVCWPADAGGDVPEWLVGTILRLLAIEPAARFESAAALIDELEDPGAARPHRAAAAPEALEPRGVGVLPFRNTREAPDDDWLGYAVASHLWRALSEVPGLYAPGQDALVTALARLEVDPGEADARQLLEAGRLVGAGTIVCGRFERDGPVLRIWLDVLRAGRAHPEGTAYVEGALAELGDLEATLAEELLRLLALERPGAARAAAGRAPALAARERFVLGKQAFLRGDYEEAIALAEEAVQRDPQFAEAIGFIGVCLARLGRYAAAEAQHRAEQALAQSRGDARLEVEALANLGVMNYFRGEYAAAEREFAAAAERAAARGLATEHAQICNNLGFVLMRRGRPEEAERAFLRSIGTHRAYGGLTSLVGPYNGMGNVLVEQKRYAEAREYYRRALALAVEVGDRTSVGTTHMHLGRCAALAEDFAEAQHEFTMALNALEETRFWNGLARAYEYMAEMNLRLANHEEAARCADKRIELARQHANTRMEAAAWRQKADALERSGRGEEAAGCRRRAAEIEAAAPAG